MNYPYGEDDDDIQDYVHPCQHCDYHKKRAQLWREEAYRQAGHPLPERVWVGLTKDEVETLSYQAEGNTWKAVELAEAKLKEKNYG